MSVLKVENKYNLFKDVNKLSRLLFIPSWNGGSFSNINIFKYLEHYNLYYRPKNVDLLYHVYGAVLSVPTNKDPNDISGNMYWSAQTIIIGVNTLYGVAYIDIKDMIRSGSVYFELKEYLL